MQEHLETCAACAAEYSFEGAVLRDLKLKLRRVELPPELVGRIVRRIDEARTQDGGSLEGD